MAQPALPLALALAVLLLLASTARSQEDAPSPTAEPPASGAEEGSHSQIANSPISQSHPPTASSAPAPAPSADTAADAPPVSPPPARPKTSPVAAPSSDEYKGNEEDDDSKPSPSPAPAADQIKAASATAAGGGEPEPEPEEEGHRELNGGGKAGVVLGSFAAAAVLGLGVFVWRKRRANIRRARYADYAARMELV